MYSCCRMLCSYNADYCAFLIAESCAFLFADHTYAQFNYVPSTHYTFRTFISSTKTISIDVVFDDSENAIVTLTDETPQTGDKEYSHIFLPENSEYSFDENDNTLTINSNGSLYKAINIVQETSQEMTTGKRYVPTCPGCKTGSGGCILSSIKVSNTCWQICCEDDGGDDICTVCNALKWVEEETNFSNDPILIIRVAGNLTIQ